MMLMRKITVLSILLHTLVCLSAAQTSAPQPTPQAVPVDSQSTPPTVRQTLPTMRAVKVTLPPAIMKMAEEASHLMSEGRFAESALAWTKVIAASPKFALAYGNRGFCNSQLGKTQLAIDDLST